jgi:hypothetical protein
VYNTGSGATAFVAAGTSGQILQSNGTSAPSWITNTAIGVSQSWSDVTSSRAANTNYTNSTGKPIMVNIFRNSSDGTDPKDLIVGGVTVARVNPDVNDGGMATAIVPNGATYSFTGSFSFWAELR